MKMRKIVSLALSVIMAVGCFAGCEKGGDDVEIQDIRDITAKELVSEMKIGWNLGNTLDADAADGLAAETSWGNPETKEEMVKFVKDSGFNVLRVPVTWNKHMDDKYNVDPEWMARVKEVVDYGIKNDMYVILNTHHEDWYFPTEDNKEDDIEQIKALWKQIAEEFKGYDEHLIFEGLNEPRLRDTPNEWNGGTEKARAIVNEYEKAFYETVRNSGGNNPKRHLMITGYAASSNGSALRDIEVPKDDDKVIISVHAYLPYSLALDKNGKDKFEPEADTSSIDSLFLNLDNLFLADDIPVIIGEFGVMNKFNDADRIECVKYYLSVAKQYGVPCVWWDNGAFVGSGENFGLLQRFQPYEWRFQSIVDAMMETVK